MDTFDAQMAARVWQRVVGEQHPANHPDLPTLLEGERQDAAVLRSLARRYSGMRRRKLERLAAETDSQAACLKGIARLMGEKPKDVRPVLPVKESPAVLLQRCYVNAVGRLATYEGSAAHPEYGRAFTQMTRQKENHCRVLLELIGSLEK